MIKAKVLDLRTVMSLDGLFRGFITGSGNHREKKLINQVMYRAREPTDFVSE